MSGMQRRKGAHGERELAQAMLSLGLMCRRSVQYCGRPGNAADVVCEFLPMHLEVKRTEKLRLLDATVQAHADAHGRPWSVAYRSNGRPWLMIMPLDQWAADSMMVRDARAQRAALVAQVAANMDANF
jgi:Holliday junction resolvase